MTEQIKVNGQFELPVPTGDILRAVIVDVDIEPPNGSVLIYGMTSPSEMTPIQIDGSQKDIKLPFINGNIAITHLGKVTKCSVITKGFVDNVRRL
ncbi:hypothetical protein TAL182_CH03015 [Rhizobium sp. TAL182]|uniref:hypothetical protein n=1 Tax=Rhizobium sp. TAL182 TaxID=2020313 RepID=UPI000A20FDEA|nr:hypothetical protein [Rhizobium sp. TAL182]ARO24761.1 hypothetical protein TAL182_CH03015 [Rhizobium sp. TAL182]